MKKGVTRPPPRTETDSCQPHSRDDDDGHDHGHGHDDDDDAFKLEQDLARGVGYFGNDSDED